MHTVSLPSIHLRDLAVSRLIVGGNPFSGFSHRSAELDTAMTDYFTGERIRDTLLHCERHGLTAMVLRGDRHIQRVVREYRNAGGQMHWIAQIASELADLPGHVRHLASLGAAAIYHHGSRTDNLWHAGRLDEARELLAVMRATGLPVGLASHLPEVIERVEEEGWDLDFYVCSAYNLNRTERESQLVSGVRNDNGEVYDPADRDRMLGVVRTVGKPCLMIKVLAAGRHGTTPEATRAAFAYVLERIKPEDGLVVGVFPRDHDQVAENAAIVRELCSDRALP